MGVPGRDVQDSSGSQATRSSSRGSFENISTIACACRCGSGCARSRVSGSTGPTTPPGRRTRRGRYVPTGGGTPCGPRAGRVDHDVDGVDVQARGRRRRTRPVRAASLLKSLRVRSRWAWRRRRGWHRPGRSPCPAARRDGHSRAWCGRTPGPCPHCGRWRRTLDGPSRGPRGSGAPWPRRWRRGGDLVEHGVGHVAADEAVHGTVEGGREQQGLVVPLEAAEHPLDLGHEAHVGHAVGLVEDDFLEVRHRQLTTVAEVDEPPGGGDDDVDAPAELLDLALDVGAAVDGHGVESGRLGQRLEHLAHLDGELRVGTSTSAFGRPGAVDRGRLGALQQGHAERQRLTASRSWPCRRRPGRRGRPPQSWPGWRTGRGCPAPRGRRR